MKNAGKDNQAQIVRVIFSLLSDIRQEEGPVCLVEYVFNYFSVHTTALIAWGDI